eukprot:g4487.t1
MEDLVVPMGYPLDRHEVWTGDGYVLSVYRIRHGRNSSHPLGTSRPVVYLQHGLLDSSAAFAMNGVDGSIAFTLADAGFDVWLGNSRGNTFSNFEMQVGMTHDAFWDFSLDELIFHDLPSTLNYVLQETSVRKLIYIGHSQGTAIAHALFASDHPIVNHIALAVMIAPVAFVKHITSPFLRALAYSKTDQWVKLFGFHQFLPSQEILHIFGRTYCRDPSHSCEDLVAVLFGYNPDNIDPDKWATFLKYTPAGTSVKVMAHWSQGVRAFSNAQFCAFDYGRKCWSWYKMKYQSCNQVIYRSFNPPEYDVSKIKVPMVFFRGGHDALSDTHDVLLLKNLLEPGVLIYEQLYQDYEHVDFLWGKNAPERVCVKMVNLLRKFFGPTMDPEKPLRELSVWDSDSSGSLF